MRRLPIVIALAAAAALAGCQGKVQRAACPADKICLEYGNEIEPLTLDPQTANLTNEIRIIGDLMVGLTTEAADGKALPGMATSWETSADGLTWTFHLRDAKWSDGVPVTAEDFVFAYRRILDPKTASIYAYLVTLLKNGQAVNDGKAPLSAVGAAAPDPHTLVLTLEHPAPYLPQLAMHSSFYPVPKHAVERLGEAWTRPGTYVSNGAYRLTAWRLGDYVRVEKNPRFFDAAHVCVDRINYYPTTDVISAERRVQRGELDLNTTFQSNRLQHIEAVMPGYARPALTLATVYASFNTRNVAPLKDIRVRRALSEAIDRDFMTAKLMRAGQQPATSFVPPGVSNYAYGARLRWAGGGFAQRQVEARALLAQAGYGPRHPLKLEIKTANSTETLLLAEAIQADWRAIGVDASIVQNEGQIAFAAYRNRDFQVGLMSWYADFDDPVTFLGLLKSDTGAQNYGDYKNSAYDALLDAADKEPDAAKRAQILRRAEQIMLDDEGTAPIDYNVSRSLVNPRITGWVSNPLNNHRARWLCMKR
ncbi:MAG: peptide ABC transporter substrate-binding protein [Phenylobacterium sp.]